MIFNEQSSMAQIYEAVMIISKSIDQNPNFLVEINEKFNKINEDINNLELNNEEMKTEIDNINKEIDNINNKISSSSSNPVSFISQNVHKPYKPQEPLTKNKTLEYKSQSGSSYYTCINGKQVEITHKKEYQQHIKNLEDILKNAKMPKLNRIKINDRWTNI